MYSLECNREVQQHHYDAIVARVLQNNKLCFFFLPIMLCSNSHAHFDLLFPNDVPIMLEIFIIILTKKVDNTKYETKK